MIGKPISLTPDNELREIFKVMDENGDGYIGAKELRKMMKNIGQKCSKKEIKKMIEVADVNQDGKVSFEGNKNSTLRCFFLALWGLDIGGLI